MWFHLWHLRALRWWILVDVISRQLILLQSRVLSAHYKGMTNTSHKASPALSAWWERSDVREPTSDRTATWRDVCVGTMIRNSPVFDTLGNVLQQIIYSCLKAWRYPRFVLREIKKKKSAKLSGQVAHVSCVWIAGNRGGGSEVARWSGSFRILLPSALDVPEQQSAWNVSLLVLINVDEMWFWNMHHR